MNAIKHYTATADSYLLLASLADIALTDIAVKYPLFRPAHTAEVAYSLRRALDLARKEEKSFREAARAAETALSQAV